MTTLWGDGHHEWRVMVGMYHPDGCGGTIALELGEDEADATDDVVRRRLVGGEGDELDGKLAGVGAKDEVAFVEVHKAKGERGSAANGVERGLVGSIGGQGVVVTVEDDDGSDGDEGIHGGGLLGWFERCGAAFLSLVDGEGLCSWRGYEFAGR